MKKIFFTAIAALVCFCSCTNKGGFSYGLIPVCSSNDLWGYIDHEGKYVINPQFSEAYFFADGLALVKSQDDKWGYIDKSGSYAILPEYKFATHFSEGLAMATKEDSPPTCIDKKGAVQFTLKDATSLSIFSDGLAIVVSQDGNFGYANKQGEIVINPQFEMSLFFSDGLAPVKSQDGKCGFINKHGEMVINPQFELKENIVAFSEGMMLVSDGKKHGYINKKGLYVINPQFDDALPFSEGLAAAKIGGLWGFIDAKGKIVINPQFDKVESFSNGLASIRKDSKWSYIDKTGKYVFNQQFDHAGKFLAHDIAPVKENNGLYGFINRKGEYVINPQFKNVIYSNSLNLINTNNSDIEHLFTKNDYYDFSECIRELFCSAESQTFDGTNNQTTLQDLVNRYSGENLNVKDEYSIQCKESTKLDKNVTCDKSYSFSSPIYSLSYSNYNWSPQRVFNYNARVSCVSYEVSYSGQVQNQRLFATAIKQEIERIYGEEMQSTTGEGYSLGKTEKHLGFTISDNDYGRVLLKVTYSQDIVEKTSGSSSVAKNNTTSHPAEPKMVFVQGGTFTMGCTSEQGRDCFDGEKPAHRVTVSSFNIGKYEVTQAQWKAIMGNNPSHFKGDNLPVEMVSWDDVQEFIRLLNAKTGKKYRLPTEAEWEYAARGGNKSNGYKYSGSNNIDNVTWYDENSNSTTHPVGTKQANELGIYDMTGNVFEWCSDWHGDYSSAAQSNPTGTSSGSDRVIRGGSWYLRALFCRVSYRLYCPPGFNDYRLGFRLVVP